MTSAADGSRAARWPGFIVIGAMKSATTTLHRYLSNHPDLFMAEQKELMFFSRDEVYARGVDWYSGHFARARPDQLCGESSTCYSRHLRYPLAARRIAEHIPHAKLIYLMRHPVERVYSHYGHTAQERWLQGSRDCVLSLEEFLEGDPEGEEALDASDYMRQIEEYLVYFPRERMLLMTMDAFRRDPQAALDEVQAFLGVEPRNLVEEMGRLHTNQRGGLVARRKVAEALRRVRRVPIVAQVADAVGPRARERVFRSVRDVISAAPVVKGMNERFAAALSPLTPEVRRRLVARFDGPTRRLEELLGEDLSAWRR